HWLLNEDEVTWKDFSQHAPVVIQASADGNGKADGFESMPGHGKVIAGRKRLNLTRDTAKAPEPAEVLKHGSAGDYRTALNRSADTPYRLWRWGVLLTRVCCECAFRSLFDDGTEERKQAVGVVVEHELVTSVPDVLTDAL